MLVRHSEEGWAMTLVPRDPSAPGRALTFDPQTNAVLKEEAYERYDPRERHMDFRRQIHAR